MTLRVKAMLALSSSFFLTMFFAFEAANNNQDIYVIIYCILGLIPLAGMVYIVRHTEHKKLKEEK